MAWPGVKAPAWVDAIDLQHEVDRAVAGWHPAGADTPTRLRGFALPAVEAAGCAGAE